MRSFLGLGADSEPYHPGQMELESRTACVCVRCGSAPSEETYVAHEDLLGGFEVPPDLTVHGVQDHNAVIGENIEHVSHTEAWEEQTQPWLCPS